MNLTEVLPAVLLASLVVLVGSWAGFAALVVLRPFSYITQAERWHPPFAVTDLVRRSKVPRVMFYLDQLERTKEGHRRLAYACQITPWINAIVIDRSFLAIASTIQLLFVVGHELGHHRMGHANVMGVIRQLTLVWVGMGQPIGPSGQAQREAAADEYARLMTGVARNVLNGIYFSSTL